MQMTSTMQIGLDTPIAALTPRQFFSMQKEWQDTNAQPLKSDGAKERRIVHTLDELANALGTSKATVCRMKAAGQLDDCISQGGKWMVIDVDRVTEKFLLKNRRRNGRRHESAI